MSDQGARYLIIKRGLYYRPDSSGYTGLKDEAGRYTFEQASAWSHPNGIGGPRDGMSFQHEDEAPDYAPACCRDVKQKHMDRKAQARIAELEAENERLRALEAGRQMAIDAARLPPNGEDWKTAGLAGYWLAQSEYWLAELPAHGLPEQAVEDLRCNARAAVHDAIEATEEAAWKKAEAEAARDAADARQWRRHVEQAARLFAILEQEDPA